MRMSALAVIWLDISISTMVRYLEYGTEAYMVLPWLTGASERREIFGATACSVQDNIFTDGHHGLGYPVASLQKRVRPQEERCWRTNASCRQTCLIDQVHVTDY
jgi:hypothetical protein